MLSKNNFKERLRKMEDRQDRFSIRKFSIGAVSVLIGSFIFGVQSTQVVHADTLAEKDSTVVSTKDSSKVVAKSNSDTSNPSSNNHLQSANQTIDTNTAKLEHKATTSELKPVSSNTISAVKQATPDIESGSNNQTLLTKSNAINQSQPNTQESSNNQENSVSTINNPSVNDKENTEKADTLNTDTTISDAPNYPDTHGVVPTTQYIFDQFTLTNGQLTNNAYTPLNMLITLTTDRNNPGNKLNYYITNNNYSEVYANDTINVDQYVNYTGVGPYPSSNLVIYNFGPNGISVNENNNNFGLAFTFGYGKYDSIINSSDPNPFSSSNVSNAWGDTTPTNVTQTITYVDAQTGQPMPNTPTIESNGLTGQIYQVDPAAEKIIKGYYLVNKERDHGVISQYKNGGTYTNEWVSQSGQLIKEVWHQINSNGVMQVDVYINNVQKYDPLGHIIPVTPDGNPIPNAPTPQYTNSPTNPSAVEPNEPVPNIPGYTPKVSTVTPTDPGTDTKVIYVPIEQGSITVTVHDVTDNVNLPQYGKSSGEQDVGTRFTYDKNTVITDLENKGYKVLNPDVVIPTTISKGAQNIVINVEHELVPVTPENPGTPGQPINPNNPDGPKWPDGTAKNNLEATGTQTIHYEGAGNKTPADNIQHFTFTKSATVDKVTGKVVSETGWNVSSHTFGNVDTPVVAGYHADKAVAGGATITPDDLNKTIVVTYAPNGHVIPVGPNGQPIPDAPQPQFPTNPDNPTGTTPSEVPVVPGYHPETGKPGDPVDPVPGKPGENVPVKYVPDTPTPETYNGSQTIKFVDGNGTELHTPDIQTADKLTGDHTFGKINTPVIKGYTTTETTAGGATVTKNNPNAVITVTYTPNGHIIPVGPDGKPIPDAPQPQFPTSPDNPSETIPGQVPDVPGYHPESGKPGEPVNPVPGKPGENVPVKYVPDTPTPETYNGSQTIKFVDGTTGKEIESPNVQTATNLTGDHTFGKINTPVIKGYTTTETTAGGATVTKENPNAVITVTYTPNGHIIPVGPDGKPIPDAPQPQFPTNPDNPSETTPGQVPDVPGYHPESGKPGEPVDPVPGKPGENVPVKYVPDTPTPETYTGSQTIKFVDGNGTELHTPDTQTVTNLTGDHTFGKINTPVIKGYTTTETTAGGATVTKENPNAVITVTYTPNGHIIPVGPDGKPIPDAPQPQFPTNPDNPSETTPGQVPDVPGYHPESGKPGEPVNSVPGKPGEDIPVKYVPDTPETYTGSQTIKFVDGNGTELHTPDTQTVTNLTGDHTFGKINTPVIKGYTTTQITAGGATVTRDNPNAVVTVTYIPNGHIIPVGPNGKPIPSADQPQFPTNPENPTETTPGQLPVVPGYHPEVGKPGENVNPVPGKPGEDVPVKYVPDTPVKPSTPFTPTTPETPRNNPTRPSETPIANNVESNKKKEELPQTGRKENQAQLIGLAVAGISFLLGLIGDRKKKE